MGFGGLEIECGGQASGEQIPETRGSKYKKAAEQKLYVFIEFDCLSFLFFKGSYE